MFISETFYLRVSVVRGDSGSANMTFAARQIQEKCRKQHRDLHMIFIDLTKALNTVHRERLWMFLTKICCPQKCTNLIKSLHDGMLGHVLNNEETSAPYDITGTGTKLGCVLAPLLFNCFY